MDDPNRQRRHHDLLTDHASKSRFASQPARSINQPSGSNRLRPAPINTSPQTPRSISTSSNYPGYYQESPSSFSSSNMPSAALGGYGTDYAQDGRQQSHNFGGYGTAAMMYNVPQPSTQNSVYDTQQFGSRQATSLQMMAPDVASTYFGPEATNASTSNLHQSSQPSGSTANVYQQSPSMQYGGSMSGISGVQQTPGSADISMNDNPEYSDGALEEKWINYQRQLGTIFQDIAGGSLETASETLLSISSWLLSQVVDLGLSLDDASLHADRIKLWNDFNHAWLALGHRQTGLMQPGQQLSRSQSLMSRETIEKLGNELIKLCDGLERHGLVDYQYGVWEEQIVAVLEDCLDLYEPETGGDSSAPPRS